MLSISQRLVGLYILYEIYLDENVKTTPFYMLVLELLSRVETLHVAEQKLLTDFIKSAPKNSKLTPIDYIKEAQINHQPISHIDLELYRKTHIENMPKTTPLNASSVINQIHDEENTKPIQT